MTKHVFFATGFRPFFLLGAVFVVLAMPLWVASLAGWLPLQPALPPVTWHAHEMIWGFTAAIIAVFLLTAVQNWTGRTTATGAGLAEFVVLWLAGRGVALAGGALPAWLSIGLCVGFLPMLAVVVEVPIAKARRWRNIGCRGCCWRRRSGCTRWCTRRS